MKVTKTVEFTLDEVAAAMIAAAVPVIGEPPEGFHYEAESAGYSGMQPVKVETVENEVEKAVDQPPAPAETVTP